MRRVFYHLAQALRYSLNGLKACAQSEVAFRQELFLACIPLMISASLELSISEMLLLWISYTLILIVELINSAIETTVDYISLEKHPLAGKIKDLSSAAVFISIVLFGTVSGVLVFKAH